MSVRKRLRLTNRASVLHAAGDAISLLMGDECGRLTALSWETHRSGPTDGMGLGSIALNKLDLGTVRTDTHTLWKSKGVFLFGAYVKGLHPYYNHTTRWCARLCWLSRWGLANRTPDPRRARVSFLCANEPNRSPYSSAQRQG